MRELTSDGSRRVASRHDHADGAQSRGKDGEFVGARRPWSVLSLVPLALIALSAGCHATALLRLRVVDPSADGATTGRAVPAALVGVMRPDATIPEAHWSRALASDGLPTQAFADTGATPTLLRTDADGWIEYSRMIGSLVPIFRAVPMRVVVEKSGFARKEVEIDLEAGVVEVQVELDRLP